VRRFGVFLDNDKKDLRQIFIQSLGQNTCSIQPALNNTTSFNILFTHAFCTYNTALKDISERFGSDLSVHLATDGSLLDLISFPIENASKIDIQLVIVILRCLTFDINDCDGQWRR